MLQAGRDGDLAVEPVRPQCEAELGAQHLERDAAAVLQVLGEVDRGHAAPAELALDPVAVGQCQLKAIE